MLLQTGKITGEEWKSMTEAQKAPYEDVARKQKEEYQKQMEPWRCTSRRSSRCAKLFYSIFMVRTSRF
jgi:hypothetical protein